MDINYQILQTISEVGTIRIIADLPTDLLNPDEYVHSASHIIKPFVDEWERKNYLIQPLVVDVYPRHTYAVVDINNKEYDYETAHKQITPLPVYILSLSKQKKWKFFRRSTTDKRAAEDIAELHQCNGQNPLPFLSDHINGTVYLSPRTT